jgi:hypothetical protein
MRSVRSDKRGLCGLAWGTLSDTLLTAVDVPGLGKKYKRDTREEKQKKSECGREGESERRAMS